MRVSPQLISLSQARQWSTAFAAALLDQAPHALWMRWQDQRRPVMDYEVRQNALLTAWGLTWTKVTAYEAMTDRLHDTQDLSLARVRDWAKVAQAQLRPDVPLNLCQQALAHTLGCSSWAALPGRLAQINAERAGRRQLLEAEAAQAWEREHPPLRKGDWVIDHPDRADYHPSLGKVKDVYFLGGEWLIDVVLYDPDGRRIGRESPAGGGPRGFEPAISASFFQRMRKPQFPMTRDTTGYRGWSQSAERLPLRNAPFKERQKAITALALEKVEGHLQQHVGVIPPPGKALDAILDKVRAKHAEPEDPVTIIDRSQCVFIWAEAQEASWHREKTPEDRVAEIQIMATADLHRCMQDVIEGWQTQPPAEARQWTDSQLRERLIEAAFERYVAEVDGLIPREAVIRPKVDKESLVSAMQLAQQILARPIESPRPTRRRQPR
jgi:hypothetical protein